ncbi:MAG: restriction endonuclease subunit S [Prevotellaceae bacterium]|nr:restriction endonuclease subunit S [Candidatus Faecinaster equi]
MKVKDIIKRANTKEDRANTSLIYFAQGEHILPEDLTVYNKGIIAEADLGPMFYFGFKKGQLLLPSRSFESKKAAIALYDGICSEKTFVLETMDSNILLQEYLIFIFQSERFWKYCNENKSGSVNYFINWSAIADYEFDLPSLDEQKVLADKLWAAYRVKESYRKLLAATDDMVKAKFVEMFGDAEYTTLSAISKITMGTSPDSDFYNTDGEGVPFYQGKTEFGDMYIGKAVTYCTKPVREADKDEVLMSVRAPVGAVNIAIEHCCIGRGLCSIKAKDGVAEQMFIYYALKLQEKEIENLGSGSTFKAINKDQVYNISIPICELPLQQQFVDIATQAEATKASLRQSIESIDRVIKSLINQ